MKHLVQGALSVFKNPVAVLAAILIGAVVGPVLAVPVDYTITDYEVSGFAYDDDSGWRTKVTVGWQDMDNAAYQPGQVFTWDTAWNDASAGVWAFGDETLYMSDAQFWIDNIVEVWCVKLTLNRSAVPDIVPNPLPASALLFVPALGLFWRMKRRQRVAPLLNAR